MVISLSDKEENVVGKGENAGNQHFLHFQQCFRTASFKVPYSCKAVQITSETERWFFVAFVEDNTTMGSIRYFENHAIVFRAKPKEVYPIKLNSLRQISVSVALKIYN